VFVWTEAELNKSQSDAVLEPGSVFLAACPGSGKTRTLTYKIAQQLSELKSDKQRVLAITYTHRAAEEIHERIELMGVDTSQLWIGTIHSFCLEWILKPYGMYHESLQYGFRVINGHDTEQLLQTLCAAVKTSKVNEFHCAHYFTSKGRVITGCSGSLRQVASEVLDQYFALLKANRQVDFELILYYAYQLVSSTPSICVLLGSIFSAVLIDEYQDTKEIQYFILSSILKASAGKAIAFVVGDPNQAIFGSLGGFAITPADFGEMSGIEFKEMELSKNYRSSARLVEYFGNYNIYTTKIEADGKLKDYASVLTFNTETDKDDLPDEIARLIRYNMVSIGIPAHEICIVAPWWVHLASMTRKLVAALPGVEFDGPGMVPFARDIDNFWYKLSRIILTEASPQLYVRRLRWAGEILDALSDAGVPISHISRKALLRASNSIKPTETDGLAYLTLVFDELLGGFGIDYEQFDTLREHQEAFFKSSQVKIERLAKEGAKSLSEIDMFRRVFSGRTGVTISTIHGVKGAEFDAVIAYGLLDGMVPHFSDPDQADAANKLLYVICSRARKNLHLLSETGRSDGRGQTRDPTEVLVLCSFTYDDLP